jgi:hypothetical protein
MTLHVYCNGSFGDKVVPFEGDQFKVKYNSGRIEKPFTHQ